MVTITWVGMTPQRLANLVDADVLIGKPLRRALDASGKAVASEAKVLTPWNTGHLRASIKHLVDTSAIPRFVSIGTNVEYAEKVHEGTGPQPNVKAKDLELWAKRKKANAYRVAAILRKYGQKPQPFLSMGFADRIDDVKQYFQRAGREIEAAWQADR